MDIKYWTPVFVSLVLAIASVQAFADSGWNYDEDSDTTVLSYSGSPVSQSAPRPENEVVEHAGTWYYDEDSDTIVNTGERSRDNYARTNPPEIPVSGFDMAFLDL